MTDEVTNDVETMVHIARFMRNKKATTGTVFVSPPGYVYLPRPLQQFLYLVTEAAYARELSCYKVAPILRINLATWRPCEASYPAFLAEVSKALQAYTGYQGNSQMLADEATAFDHGMEMARRSLDELGGRKVNDPNEKERDRLVDNLWFEYREESTLDEKTHDPKFYKDLINLCKTTEAIKANRTNTTVFPVALVSLDAQSGLGSPTSAMLSILAQDIARHNAREPTHTYRTWHEQLREPLHRDAEWLGIPFPVFLYNISPSGSLPGASGILLGRAKSASVRGSNGEGNH